jgi:hypothetical protein
MGFVMLCPRGDPSVGSMLDVGEVLRGKTAKREMEQVNAIGGWLSVI